MRHLFFAATLAAALPFSGLPSQFIANCGDSLREIEEWSVLGNRDIDGTTREVAGELLEKQRVKAPTGWNCSWNRELSPLNRSLRRDKSAKS